MVSYTLRRRLDKSREPVEDEHGLTIAEFANCAILATPLTLPEGDPQPV